MERRRAPFLVRSGIDGDVRKRDLDAARFECLLQATQEFAARRPLLERRHPEAAAQYHRRVFEALDARDLEIGENPAGPRLVRAHVASDLAHDADRGIGVFAIGDADVDDSLRESATHVRDRRDQVIRDEMDVPVVVAQPDEAQRDVLHEPRLVRDLDDVAGRELVLEEDEEPGEIVLDEALRAKADCEPDHACGTEDRRDGNAELAQHEHCGDERHDDAREVAQHAAYRLRAPDLLGLVEVARKAGSEQAQRPVDDRGQDPRHDDDGHHAGGDDRRSAPLRPINLRQLLRERFHGDLHRFARWPGRRRGADATARTCLRAAPVLVRCRVARGHVKLQPCSRLTSS